jgi:hypothetical protein
VGKEEVLMSDPEVIADTLRSEQPVILQVRKVFSVDGSVSREEVLLDADTTPEEYEANIAEQVAAYIEGEARQAIEDEHAALRRQFRTGMAQLETNVTLLQAGITRLRDTSIALNSAQLRSALADVAETSLTVNRGMIWLGTILRNSGIFTADDDAGDTP